MGKKNELEQLRERQAAIQAQEQEKQNLAARITALEEAEAYRERAEAKAAEETRIQAARAALADAEALAIQALQVLQERLDAVQHSAAAVGPWSATLPDTLFMAVRVSVDYLKENYPERMGVTPRRIPAKLETMRDELKRLQKLAQGVDGDHARQFGYTAAIKRLKSLIAEQEGSVPETEPGLNEMDRAYMQQVTTFDLKRGKTTQAAPVEG